LEFIDSGYPNHGRVFQVRFRCGYNSGRAFRTLRGNGQEQRIVIGIGVVGQNGDGFWNTKEHRNAVVIGGNRCHIHDVWWQFSEPGARHEVDRGCRWDSDIPLLREYNVIRRIGNAITVGIVGYLSIERRWHGIESIGNVLLNRPSGRNRVRSNCARNRDGI
jgi:hypothetical protein